MDIRQISATFLATLVLLFTVYFADISKVLSSIQSANKYYLAIIFPVGFLILFLRSKVWHSFFQKLELGISQGRSFKLFSAGEFLNNVTPLGQVGGQPFMAYIISDNSGSEYEKSLATVISADFMTGFPLLIFGFLSAIYLVFNGIQSQTVIQVAVFSVFAISVTTGIVYALWFRSGTIESIILRICERVIPWKKLVKRIESVLENFQETFDTFGDDPKGLVKPSIYAHLSFFADVMVLYLVLLSIGVSVSPLYLFLVFPIANLSKSAPTSGGSGVYELALASILSVIIGIPFSDAVAAALVYRIPTYWLAIFIGYFFFSKMNYSSAEGKI